MDIDKELRRRVEARYRELTRRLPFQVFNAICKIVKEEVARAQLSQGERARLQAEIDRMKPVFDAAMADYELRNKLAYGDKSIDIKQCIIAHNKIYEAVEATKTMAVGA